MDLGIQHLEAGNRIARHRHPIGHLTLVLRGNYTEAGDDGRCQAHAGALVVHRPFSAHLNRIDRDSIVLNLPAPRAPTWSWATCRDTDHVVHLARQDPVEAAACAIEHAQAFQPSPRDWEDLLAAALSKNPSVSLGAWAGANGLRKEQVSRGFKLCYGVSPKRFRAERRAYLAWRRIVETDQPASAIAADLGFADQPHMARAVSSLTGAPPGAWRQPRRE